MHGLRPLLARRHFLASTIIGSFGLLVPIAPAGAASTPPPTPAAETVAPAPASSPAAAPTGEPIIGTAAMFEVTGDSSIRPFTYRARDEDLAELERRIKATRWPDRETVNDET